MFKKIMILFIGIVLILSILLILFMKQSKFGKLPEETRLEKIKQSPNFKDGAFQNIHETPDLTEGATYYSLIKDYIFTKRERLKPIDSIPSKKTNLLTLKPEDDVLVWFGHSSYFIQIDGKKILVDPVFSGSISPIASLAKAFKGTDIYSVNDLPEIDYLFISHDHWDHLDFETIVNLKSKVKKVICGLGVGAHFEHWGFDANKIIEKDWNQQIDLSDGFTVFTTTARHFSGRGFKRNQSLWLSFVLKTPTQQIFIGGDSGYDTHFSEIGKKYGVFDLVILENGQYDKSWKYIHMMPNEVLQAAKDLNAKCLFPVHSSKFILANHPWDEPLEKITTLNEIQKVKLITPMIGEKVDLKDSLQIFTKWWKEVLK